DWDCPDVGAPLAPGEQRVCTAKFDIVRPIFESGSVYNLATAYAYSAFGAPLATSAYNLLTFEPQAGLALTKTADRSSVRGVDDPITYTLTVQNTGGETINAVRVIDPMLTEVSCDVASGRLAPGATMICTGVGYADQYQVDAGVVPNTAMAVGERASGNVFDPSDDIIASASTELSAEAAPAAELRVTASPGEVRRGEVVRFTLELTNTGNLTLQEFDWTFSRPVSSVVCDTDLPRLPGQGLVCWVDYVATAADEAAGSALLEVSLTSQTARPGVEFGPMSALGIVPVVAPDIDDSGDDHGTPAPADPSDPPRPAEPQQVGHQDRPGKLPRTGGLGVRLASCQ
ncbi:MAG: hypothetical protein Q4G46_15150, partial [Propionibacteriaceae bacterium]|nr:hypothetical protein [Propionibacteriaceae bacterium]